MAIFLRWRDAFVSKLMPEAARLGNPLDLA